MTDHNDRTMRFQPDPEGIIRPWDHHIRTTYVPEEVIGGEEISHAMIRHPEHLLAYCTCGKYKRAHPLQTDVLDMVMDAREHIGTHPNDPKSMVQLGDGTVLLVMAVPGEGELDEVHMTISVPKEVWEDQGQLDDFLGPIGSPAHFLLAAQRQRYLEHSPDERGHAERSVRVVSMPGDAFRSHLADASADGSAQAWQGFLDFLRGGNTDIPGVAMFQGPADAAAAWAARDVVGHMADFHGFLREEPPADEQPAAPDTEATPSDG